MKSSSLLRFRRALAAGCCLGIAHLAFALPVFPGAVGFGTDTVAARGITAMSQIYHVTNLNDTGTGSLRDAVGKSGPRVIIFDVAGVISLASDLRISNGNLMIAGQTAPYPGITLKGCGIQIWASDILIQHIAIRPGNIVGDAHALSNRDCIKVEPQSGVTVQNVVIDHVSMSWAVDETASVWGKFDNAQGPESFAKKVTFLNCIFSKPILNGGHEKGSHGYGLLIGRNTSEVSVIGNLFAFCLARNPLVDDTTKGAQIVNNYIYAPGANSNAAVYMQGGLAPYKVSLVSNVFVRKAAPFSLMLHLDGDPIDIHDPNNPNDDELIEVNHSYNYTSPVFKIFHYHSNGVEHEHNVIANAQVYSFDNLNLNRTTGIWGPASGNQWDGSFVSDDTAVTEAPVTAIGADPYANSGGVTWAPLSSAQVPASVMLSAGKMPGKRDPWDRALIEEVSTLTGNFVVHPADLGTDPWQGLSGPSRVLTVPSDALVVDTATGYKKFELWLQGLAREVESGPSDPISVMDTFEDNNFDGWVPDGSAPGLSIVTDGSKVLQQSDYSSDARAVLDATNWTDQTVEVNVKPTFFNGSDRLCTVYARYQDIKHGYYVALRNAPSGGQTVQLRKINGTTITTFDSETTSTFTISQNSWYRVKLKVTGSSTVTLTATVTDLTAAGSPSVTLTGTDSSSPFASGRAAVGTYFASARFDQVFASPNPNETAKVLADFDDGTAPGWSASGGTWAVDSSTKTYRQTSTGSSTTSRALRTEVSPNQSIQADVCPLNFVSSSGSVILYGRYTDTTHAYFMTLAPTGNVALKRVNGGSSTVIAGPVATPLGAVNEWSVLKLEIQGSAIRGYVNGVLTVQATDTTLTTGTAGVGTYGTTAAFDNVIMAGL